MVYEFATFDQTHRQVVAERGRDGCIDVVAVSERPSSHPRHPRSFSLWGDEVNLSDGHDERPSNAGIPGETKDMARKRCPHGRAAGAGVEWEDGHETNQEYEDPGSRSDRRFAQSD